MTVVNFIILMCILAVPVVIVWLGRVQRRLARVEAALEELRGIRPPDDGQDVRE